MHVPRIYQDVQLVTGLELQLSEDAANHLVRVLRLNAGEQFILFNGAGGEFIATILNINKKKVEVKIGGFKDISTESSLTIHLGQGISRGEKMDYAIQKAVELGVSQITPLQLEHCGVKLSPERWDKRLQHWQKIIISACEQSGRTKLPILNTPTTLSSWLTQLPPGLRILLQPNNGKSLTQFYDKPTVVHLLIGAESGLVKDEINLANQHGFANLTIGPRILRTETATVAGIALIQCYFGDMA